LSVLEKGVFRDVNLPELRINPAKGVDYPDLDLGLKSPSTNYCTSEPFFSAYERLLGSEFDCVVVLTNYQTAKKTPPLKLQITSWRYLFSTQLADKKLCRLANGIRDWLLLRDEPTAKKAFRFLAYVNHQDWRANHLLHLFARISSDSEILSYLQQVQGDFVRVNKKRLSDNKDCIPDYDLSCLTSINMITPLYLGILNAADNWVIDSHGEAARLPNENEWKRLQNSPLNGEIGMSFALQWRYNFAFLFKSNVM
jgi:hypothetical protein